VIGIFLASHFEVCVKSVHSSFPDTLTGYSVPMAVSGLNLCLSVQKTGDTGNCHYILPVIYFSVCQ